MTSVVKHGATDVSRDGRFIDPATGNPLTVDHATAGLDLWYRRPGGSKVSITPAALASLTAAHTDGGVEPIGDGWSRIDLPDLAFASGVDRVLWGGSCTGGVLLTAPIPLVAYDSQAIAVGANTTTPPTVGAIATEIWVNATSRSLTDKADFALSAAAISAIEAALVNEGDATALLQAIADKIAGDLTVGDLTAVAIAQAVWTNATRSLTDKADFSLSVASRSAITSEIWSAATRSLTDKSDFALANGSISHLTFTTGAINNNAVAGSFLTAGKFATDAFPARLFAADTLAAIRSEVVAALVQLHLDHLLGEGYDPANKPGNAAALLNAIVENDGGIPRATANFLEQGPSGGGSASDPLLLIETTIATLGSQTEFTLASGTSEDDAYNGATVVIEDQSTSTQRAVGQVLDYVGSTLTVTLAAAPTFTIATGDTVRIVARNGATTVVQAATTGTPPVRVSLNRVRAFQGEAITHTITDIVDENGDAVNLTGKTLEAVIDAKPNRENVHTDMEVVAVTVLSADSVSFANTVLSTGALGTYRLAIREPSNGNYVWYRADWIVESAATED